MRDNQGGLVLDSREVASSIEPGTRHCAGSAGWWWGGMMGHGGGSWWLSGGCKARYGPCGLHFEGGRREHVTRRLRQDKARGSILLLGPILKIFWRGMSHLFGPREHRSDKDSKTAHPRPRTSLNSSLRSLRDQRNASAKVHCILRRHICSNRSLKHVIGFSIGTPFRYIDRFRQAKPHRSTSSPCDKEALENTSHLQIVFPTMRFEQGFKLRNQHVLVLVVRALL